MCFIRLHDLDFKTVRDVSVGSWTETIGRRTCPVSFIEREKLRCVKMIDLRILCYNESSSEVLKT